MPSSLVRSLLNSVLRFGRRPRPAHRDSHSSRKRRFRPGVEQLEQRDTPTASITEYGIPTANSGAIDITRGPDGNLWFAEQQAHKVAVIGPSGAITEYAVSGDPVDLWAGPDNSVWFSEFNANLVGKINVATGQLTEYAVPTAGAGPDGITMGADGNMWFAEYNTGNIGRITPTGQITEFAAGGNPTDLALGSDGNVWFTSYNTNQVGKISTSGVATLYNAPAGAGPAGIAAGPDGNLWVTEYNSGAIAQITTAGVFTQFTIPTANSQPWAINAGAGGTLWFAESGTNQIGRVTTNGQFEEYAIPTAGSDPRGVDTAADGGVWFTEYGGNQIGKLTPEAPPSISLSVAYGTGKTVTLSGQVTDSAPGGLTVTFSGQVTGSVVTNADGSFSGTFTASGLGAVQATTTDGEGLVSNPATVTLSSTPPVISNFTGGTNIAQIWTFTGTVTAPNAPGLVVTFSGIPAVTGKTATVQANGTFELSVFIPAGQDGTVAVQTTDAWGQLSNESLWIVSM